MDYILYESSLTGLFRLLLIIFMVYIAYTFVVRFVLPNLIRNALRNFQDTAYGKEGPGYHSAQKKEGEITYTVVNEPSKKTKKTDDVEDVEYEDVS